MRFMVIMYPGPDSEAGRMPTESELAAMGAFNEELVKAGVMLGGEGLHPSSRGSRVRFAGGKPTVTDGPFTETREIIGGFWLWQCRDHEEAVAWARRCPASAGQMLEIRRVFDAADFGEAFTPELQAHEETLRQQIEAQAAQRKG